MDVDKLLGLIDKALLGISNYVAKSKVYTIDKKPISDFKKALEFLKSEVQNNPKEINERVLRATHDVSGIIAKQFEETSLAEPVFDVVDVLYEDVPYYKNLKPLGMDFGKGNPI